jgi:hypothetical protein
MNARHLLSHFGPLLIGASTFLIGCGSDAPRSPTVAQTVTPEVVLWHVNGLISENHGHKVTINMGQAENGVPVSVPLHGNPTHSHVVELSPEELREIRDGGRVVKTSSVGDGHTHVVSFSWRDNLS